MSYNTKNYAAHGGSEWVVGGKLTFMPGAQVDGLADLLDVPEGSIQQAANQADSTATTIALLKDDFNALLLKLKTAGLMVADAPAETPGE